MTTWAKKDKPSTSYQKKDKGSTSYEQKSKPSTILQKLIDWFARGWFSHGWFTGEKGYSFTKKDKPTTNWSKA